MRVISLSPGTWEVFGAVMIEWPTEYRPLAAFELPYTVTAEQTVYIVDFRAMSATDKGVRRGLSFEVRDKSARDLPIAKRADKKISDITLAIPNVSAAHTPVLISAAMLAQAASAGPAPTPGLCTGEACKTASGEAENFTIETIPSGAEVKTSTGLGCPATPCTIRAPRQTPFEVAISLSGYNPTSTSVSVADFGGAGANQHVSIFGTLGTVTNTATGRSKELTPNPLLVVLEPATTH